MSSATSPVIMTNAHDLPLARLELVREGSHVTVTYLIQERWLSRTRLDAEEVLSYYRDLKARGWTRQRRTHADEEC